MTPCNLFVTLHNKNYIAAGAKFYETDLKVTACQLLNIPPLKHLLRTWISDYPLQIINRDVEIVCSAYKSHSTPTREVKQMHK